MASEENEDVVNMENSGRRTRSGRKASSPAATPAVATRTTRRTTKRQAQLSDHEEEQEEQPVMAHEDGEGEEEEEQSQTVSQLSESTVQEVPLDDDVEMRVVTGEPVGVDEKSSSFPFGNTCAEQHSETSDDVKERRGEGSVDTSLLASLAGDNANSLPSVGDCQPLSLDNESASNVEKLNSSEDSISHQAIAESLGDGDGDNSNATIVNTEIISEDELPPPSKPEINDAEEVSDEELPAPARAELPADAEVISEDELPTHNNNNESKATQKRKADKDVKSEQSPEEKSIEQYSPGSPTTESNEAPPSEKRAKVEAESEPKDKKKEKERDKDKDKDGREKEKDKEKERHKLPDLDKYWRAVKEDATDFTGWTYLLQYVDSESDAEAAREAYDTFLSHYPYCYGYWRKYADYEKRKGIKANCYKKIPTTFNKCYNYPKKTQLQLRDITQYTISLAILARVKD